MLQSLSDEMLKLKSATKHYEETKENLQNMCASIDKISITHQILTDNMREFLAEMEKMDVEGKKTREFIKSTSDEVKRSFEAEARRYEAAVEEQTDKILQHSESQSKALRLVEYLIMLGVLMEAAVIIIVLLL